MKKRAAKAAAPEPEPQASGPMYTTVYYAVPPDDDPSDALTTEETIELVGAGVIVDSTKVWAEGDDGSMPDWEEFGLVKQKLGFPERDGGTQSGWLEKKGSFRAPWSRVYCILYPGSTPPRIGHYEAVDAAAEAGMLELSTCSAIRPSTAETAGECEFEVVNEQKGTQRLRAPSAEAMEAWLAALTPFATAKPKGKRERMHSRALAKVRPIPFFSFSSLRLASSLRSTCFSPCCCSRLWLCSNFLLTSGVFCAGRSGHGGQPAAQRHGMHRLWLRRAGGSRRGALRGEGHLRHDEVLPGRRDVRTGQVRLPALQRR